jgi:hypothetical protein
MVPITPERGQKKTRLEPGQVGPGPDQSAAASGGSASNCSVCGLANRSFPFLASGTIDARSLHFAAVKWPKFGPPFTSRVEFPRSGVSGLTTHSTRSRAVWF